MIGIYAMRCVFGVQELQYCLNWVLPKRALYKARYKSRIQCSLETILNNEVILVSR